MNVAVAPKSSASISRRIRVMIVDDVVVVRGLFSRWLEANLLADFKPLGTFDLVFCRNVLIYFDQIAKTQELERRARQIPGDGFLVLGAAETVVGLTEAFRPVAEKRGLYAPNIVARGGGQQCSGVRGKVVARFLIFSKI